MIEKFSLVAPGISLTVDLEKKLSIYQNNPKELVIEYFNSATKGVSWISDGVAHIFLEEEMQLTGFPSVDLQKVAIIYPRSHNLFKAPNNAVIFRCDGKELFGLKMPELISLHASELRKRTRADLTRTAYFREAYWSKGAEGNTRMTITIDFGWDWWEARILDVDTGEFGVCIDSGRR